MSDTPPTPSYFVETGGKQYGPVDLDGLQKWVKEGRILPETVLIEASTGQRIIAKDFPGLLPPPVVGQNFADPTQYGVGFESVPPSKKPTPVLVVVLIVVVALCGCGLPIIAAILFPVFAQAKFAAKRTAGLSNLKQVGLATLIYAQDYDDKYPPDMSSALAVQPVISPYAKNPAIFVSINPDGGTVLGNSKLSGKASSAIADPAHTVMFYDSKPWRGKGMVEFADGSAKCSQPFDDVMATLETDPFGK